MRPCFKFTAAAKADEPETLSIYDEIGFRGVQAKDFTRDLSAVKSKVLNVEINSPGGDVFAGLAIYNALKGSGKEIVVKVMGVAASAASLVMMAGDKRIMPKNTFTMVHNPWSFAMGNADELRETADTLDKIGEALQATYVAATGQSEEKIKELLSKDTWLTAEESLELGFATEVIEDVKVKAAFDMDRADLPDAVKAIYAKESPAPEPKDEEIQDSDDSSVTNEPVVPDTPVAKQIEAMANTAGLRAYAATFAVACASVEEAKARILDASEIVALCAVAKRPDDAGKAIRANKTVAEVRAALIAAMAEADEHTDNAPPARGPSNTGGAGMMSAKAVYEKRAARRQNSRKGN